MTMDWATAKLVVAAHMQDKGVTQYELANLAALPTSTVYTAFRDDNGGRVSFNNVAAMLRGLGLTFAWLEEKCKPAPDESAGKKAKRRPARAGA